MIDLKMYNRVVCSYVY